MQGWLCLLVASESCNFRDAVNNLPFWPKNLPAFTSFCISPKITDYFLWVYGFQVSLIGSFS